LCQKQVNTGGFNSAWSNMGNTVWAPPTRRQVNYRAYLSLPIIADDYDNSEWYKRAVGAIWHRLGA
jgi:hypothetical protein